MYTAQEKERHKVMQPKILPIVTYGCPILRQKCEPVDNTPENMAKLHDLLATAQSIHSSVGLAFPQIGVPLNAFITLINDQKKIVINPVIRKRRGSQISDEGCLSIPGIFTKVSERDDIIEVEYYDEKFNKQKRSLRKFEAVIFSHEFDHLNGILFIDYLTKEGREEIKEKLSNIENGKIQTHYDMIFSNGNVLKAEIA